MAIERAREPKRPSLPDEIRCDCGRLIARRVPGGIELRCSRCKERFLIDLSEEESSAAGKVNLPVVRIA